MPHYVTIQIDVHDPETIAAYRDRAIEPVARHGGMMIAGGPDCEVLEDTGAGRPVSVLLSFPNAAAVRGWLEDPEFRALHALRRKAAKTVITMLPPKD